MNKVSILLPVVFLLFAHHSEASSDCSSDSESKEESKRTNLLKGIAVGSILGAGAGGVLVPILGRSIPFLNPEKDGFFAVKSFAAGVILATAFVHILPDAFEMLGSACLPSRPWQEFPFAGFVSMLSALGTMLIESITTCYYKKSHFAKPQPIDEERIKPGDENAHQGHVHAHTHASHGHAHGAAAGGGLPHPDASATQRIRHRIISQVLEVGIVAHSVIIGISLGTSENAKTIKPLVLALSFHQFFEGVGLGGCIVQADFKARATMIMTIFFSLTAPLGIVLGIAISSSYDPNGTKALIIEGIFNAASAGILIYMSLVDLLAANLTNPRMQNSIKLQVGAHVALLIGCGFMSLLAKWA